MGPDIRIFADTGELSRAAAAEFARLAGEAVRADGRFTVALAGGSTPRGAYTLLAEEPSLRNQVPWDRTHCFWGDERPVPPDHSESNFRMADETMLSKVSIPPENVHRIRGECPDTALAAEEYERTLHDCFHPAKGAFPRFDLVLLGLGCDGHTASLFPGTPALRERRRLVVSNWVAQLETERITLTLPVLNSAASIIFLVAGEEKAAALKSVLEGNAGQPIPPAGRIRPERGTLTWLLDRPAARLISQTDPE